MKSLEQRRKDCQEAMEVSDCESCPGLQACQELYWETVEAKRQPNGRFGKIYKEDKVRV